ncbi:hypothetical protein Tco_1255843 [Tanacetum coccineum]
MYFRYSTPSWGRKDYARAIIDLRADRALKNTLIIYVPSLDGNGCMIFNVKVEYEGKPPRCGTCLVSGHDDVLSPKRAIIERKDFRRPVTREQEVKVDRNQPKKQQFIPIKMKTAKGASISTSTLVSKVFEVLGDLEDDGHLDALNAEDPKCDSGYTHMEEIWNANSSSKSSFTSPNHFDLLTKEDGKSILRNLQKSDANADVEIGCDDTTNPSKSLENSPGGNT